MPAHRSAAAVAQSKSLALRLLTALGGQEQQLRGADLEHGCARGRQHHIRGSDKSTAHVVRREVVTTGGWIAVERQREVQRTGVVYRGIRGAEQVGRLGAEPERRPGAEAAYRQGWTI